MFNQNNPIKVARPKLPTACHLKNYLEMIDTTRHYSNFGPLVSKFEDTISVELGFRNKRVAASASSGTAALELTIRQFQFPVGSYVMLPSFTFIATAQAVVNAGLKPIFTDVDIESWALEPDKAFCHIKKVKCNVKAVIAVAPFGSPIKMDAWEQFQRKTGIQVIIDAAACCLKNVSVSNIIPIMVSTHATKVLPTGEGGLVIMDDTARLTKISNLSNFGIGDSGVLTHGTNHKLSEYHAAIGLSSIDMWESTSTQLNYRCSLYHDLLRDVDEISFLPGFGKTWFNITCMINGPAGLGEYLLQAGIETRKWWRNGCHREPVFERKKHFFSVTEAIADTYIGLPMYVDLEPDKIHFICEHVKNFCSQKSKP